MKKLLLLSFVLLGVTAHGASLHLQNYTGTNCLGYVGGTNVFVFNPGETLMPGWADDATVTFYANGIEAGTVAFGDYVTVESSQVRVVLSPSLLSAQSERSDTNWTLLGFSVGFGWFGIGWIFKLVRRVAHTAPEI